MILAKPALERSRDAVVQEARATTGIDEGLIDRLVQAFYAKVRADALIGPVFDERIANWQPHLEQMNAFWASVMLSTGSYQGRPMQKHLTLPVERAHFDRWLTLFEETARETCLDAVATLFIGRARRIAESLEIGIANARGMIFVEPRSDAAPRG